MHKRYYSLLLVLLTMVSCVSTKPLVGKNATNWKNTDAVQRQFDYYFYEGLRLKENQQYDQALETFRLCLSIDSLNAAAHAEMSLLYASMSLNDDAIRYMENAVRLDPANWWYNVRLISMHTDLTHFQRAIEITCNLQKKYPQKEQVYDILATLYKQTKEYEKAIAAYDKLEILKGIDETLSFEKYQLYQLAKKQKKGIAEIDKLINKYPTDTRYRLLRANIFMDQEMPEKAFEIYQKIVSDEPTNGYVYVSLSKYYQAVNQPEKAMEYIVSALKNDQMDVDTKMEVLTQYVEKLMQDSTKFAETGSLFRLLVDRYPLEEQVHGYYADFLQLTNQNSAAVPELETMLIINPKNDQTWLRLIQLYLSEKNYNQLMTVTKRAIEILPTVPTWYYYRGIAQYQLADYTGALATDQSALPLIKEGQLILKGDFFSQIACLYYKLGQKKQAFAAYEDALSANPKNIIVMNNYAYYLSLEKSELKKAELMSAKTVELEPDNSTYLDTYAWILYQQGNYSLAKFYIEKAVENLPKDDHSGTILEHYGDILWMLNNGKYDQKALEMWQKSYDSGNKTEELKQKITNKGWTR